MKILSIRLFLSLLITVIVFGCTKMDSGFLGKTSKQTEVVAEAPETVHKHFEQVTASRLNLRESSSSKAKILAVLNRGESVEILTEKEGWAEVRTDSGWLGWVASAYLTGFEKEQSARSGEEQKQTFKNNKLVEQETKVAELTGMDQGTPRSGEAIGKLVVDGKTVQITKASAISGPDRFHPERKTVVVVLSDEQLSSGLIEGAKSVSEIEEAAPQNSVVLEIRPGSYALTVRHEILGDQGLMETMGGDPTGELKLEEDRVSGLIQTVTGGPIPMLGHEVEYEIRFDSAILRDFPLVVKVEPVLSDGAKKLSADGAEPGRAYLDACRAEEKEKAEKKDAMKNLETLRMYMEKRGELPTPEALEEFGKTLDEFLAMMIEMNAAMEGLGGNDGGGPKTCEVLGGRSDGKVALLQAQETSAGKTLPKDVTLVHTEDGWKVYSVVPGGGNPQPGLSVTVNKKPVPMRVALAVGEGEDSMFIFSSIALTCEEMIGEIKNRGRSLHKDEVTFKLTRQPALQGEGWRWSTYFDGNTRQAGDETKMEVDKIDLKAGSKIKGTLETTLRACCGDRADLLEAKGSFEAIGCGSAEDVNNKPGANRNTETAPVQAKPAVALEEGGEFESTDSFGEVQKQTFKNDKVVKQETKAVDLTGQDLGPPGSGQMNYGAMPNNANKTTETYAVKLFRTKWMKKTADPNSEPEEPFKANDVIQFSITYDKSSKKIKRYNTGPDGIIQWGKGDDKTFTVESRQLNTTRLGKLPFTYFSNVEMSFDPKTQKYFTQQDPCFNQEYQAFIRAYPDDSAEIFYQICDNLFSIDLLSRKPNNISIHGNIEIKLKDGTWSGGFVANTK